MFIITVQNTNPFAAQSTREMAKNIAHFVKFMSPDGWGTQAHVVTVFDEIKHSGLPIPTSGDVCVVIRRSGSMLKHVKIRRKKEPA